MVGTVQAPSDVFSNVFCRTYERSLISASQFKSWRDINGCYCC